MAIRVKFFASLREQVGKHEVQIEANESKTVAQVWAQACDEIPLPTHLLMAVNMEYGNQNTPVKDGDEVAFFPPVTGG
jgi:molybdopterin synthase sulfur carrier subunit